MKKQKSNIKVKVAVGMSGGVDSSLAAALLVEQGYDVTGVFLECWRAPGCRVDEDRKDALEVAMGLGIAYKVLDFKKEYKERVVEYFYDEYKAGRTPNPDAMCNREIKFGMFYRWAMGEGFDAIATGHYARIEKIKMKNEKRKKTTKNSKSQADFLMMGADEKKDQSYFLWTLTQKQLTRTLFPVGDMKKSQVRILAKKFDFETSDKKDSQGLCFIGKIDITDFLKNFIKEKAGYVLNEAGQKIGKHNGVFYYTIGQRHGFKIIDNTNQEKPYFIISKNLKNNTLTVSHNPIKNNSTLGLKTLLKNVNWITGSIPDLKKEYSARIRYRQPLEKCHLEKYRKNKLIVNFITTQKSPTQGQSVVIYDGEICLGGGIIE